MFGRSGDVCSASSDPLASPRGVWLWSVTIHLTSALPMGSSKDLATPVLD
jgi:hypothetical protein